jgi:TDG/mug DNA glycosylase family protein
MVLPDVLQPGLLAIFCGTRAGETSGRRRMYYAGKGNKFWDVLHSSGLTTRRLAPHEFDRLREFGLGLTDLGKTSSGGDLGLRAANLDVAGFRTRVCNNAPAWIGFNGVKAAQLVLGARRVCYGQHTGRVGNAQLFVLPSTSGSANRYWEIEWWNQFSALIRGTHN